MEVVIITDFEDKYNDFRELKKKKKREKVSLLEKRAGKDKVLSHNRVANWTYLFIFKYLNTYIHLVLPYSSETQEKFLMAVGEHLAFLLR